MDVQIYRHVRGFSVYYLTQRAHQFQDRLMQVRANNWPAIDELVRLMRADGIKIDYVRAPDVAIN